MGAWDAEDWEYEVQHVNSVPEIQDPQATWTDGELLNGSSSIVESSQPAQLSTGGGEGASFVRQQLGLTFYGDIAFDNISFQFENMNCSNLLRLLTVLTDTIPVFDVTENSIMIRLIPRSEQSTVVRTVGDHQLLSPIQREQVEFLSSEALPNVSFEGLEISDAVEDAITKIYQENYYLKKHELTTIEINLLSQTGSGVPEWVSDVEIGETLRRGDLMGGTEILGKIERIELGEHSMKLLTRRILS